MNQNLALHKGLWIAIRPPTLLVGIAPGLLGLSFGFKYLEQSLTWFHYAISAVAILMVLFLQSAANLVNDAKDAEKGVDGQDRIGPLRVVQQGVVPARWVRYAYRSCFLLTALMMLAVFFLNRDWLTIGVAIGCGLAAFLYTAGPFPLSYFALGETLALIFFGPIAVMGSAYLIVQHVEWSLAFWGIGPGFLSAAIMAINNARDATQDAKAGKHTLATMLGPKIGARLPLLFISLALVVFFLYSARQHLVGAGITGAFLGALFIFYAIRPQLRRKGQSYNIALKRTAQFILLYCLFFIMCVMLSDV